MYAAEPVAFSMRGGTRTPTQSDSASNGRGGVAEAEEQLTITQAPKTSADDERPVRRRGTGQA
jgi:hypothetical protein